MDKKELKAEERKVTGRKVKNLRKEGLLPGNVFGKKVKSEAIQVVLKDFEKVFKEVGETGLVMLKVGKNEKPVLIHNLQLNPVTDKPLHVDFLQVDLKEKVEAEVPVELIEESPAEKQGIGTVVQYVNEVKVEALPTDLPESFEVDTSILTEVDQAIHIKDLKVDSSKVEIKADSEEIVAKVEPPQKEEEVAPPVSAEGEIPSEGGEAEEQAPSAEGGEQSSGPSENKEEPKE